MKKRPRLEAGDLDNWFARTDGRRTPTPYDKRNGYHTYRVPDSYHERLKAIAEENHLPLGDLVRWLVGKFVYWYDAGEIELPVEQYVVNRARLLD